MTRVRRFLDGLLTLAVMLAGDREPPSALAVETLYRLVTARGVVDLARWSRHLAPSVAGEFHDALRVLATRLASEGYEREAYQVQQLWMFGSVVIP
jgi:hypothetical protein